MVPQRNREQSGFSPRLLRRSESERRQRLDRRADRGFAISTSCSAAACSTSRSPPKARRRKRWQSVAADNGFSVIDTADELATLAPGGKVLGLFSPSTMPVQWRGTGDAKAERVQHDGGRPLLPEPFACEPNPAFAAMPTLPAMARTALERLDDGGSFMLMVESASIDKQSHLRRPCGQIGELGQLDDTLEVVLDYARAHPETLVLVTADHSQAAQLVPETSVLAGLNAASPGFLARVRTPEGVLMGVNYATNDSTLRKITRAPTCRCSRAAPGRSRFRPRFVRPRSSRYSRAI